MKHKHVSVAGVGALICTVIMGAGIVYAAANSYISQEIENGARTSLASAVLDGSASGGTAVQFGGDNPDAPAGVFITQGELARAKTRAVGTTQPYRNNYNTQKSRADAALSTTPSPFYMTQSNYINNIRYAWSWSSCPDSNPNDNNSLADAVSKLENQGDTTRTLAMQYALTGTTSYGDKARDYLLAWANNSTPVNMYDFFVNTNSWDGGLVGSDGTDCKRPWNMALDGMFQGYGLINFADAYALLTRNGYTLSSSDNTAIRNYLRSLTAAVNSSYHAWSRWADAHNCTMSNSSETCIRYRSDNHLSWGQAPILAAAAALEDQTIASYVLNGGAWDDGRSGLVTNTSHMKYVINRAVLSNGQIYDEAPAAVGGIERPGYAFYHLWAMEIAARIDDVHFHQGLWEYKGTDGQGLREAYAAEAPRVMSGQNSGDNWQYELPYNHWGDSTFLAARDKSSRNVFIAQSFGPVVLLFGQ